MRDLVVNAHPGKERRRVGKVETVPPVLHSTPKRMALMRKFDDLSAASFEVRTNPGLFAQKRS